MSDTPSEQGDKIDLIGTMRNEIDALREQLAEKDKMLKTMRPFFNEYALGPLAKPSCLCCGRNDYKSVAVQHAELPGIVVCDQCKHAEMQLAERDAEIAALKAERDTSVAVTERIKVALRIRGTGSYVEWAAYCRDALEKLERAEAELAETRRDLQFIERWANHHGQKPNITPREVLSMIQHYPPILEITRSYEDGKVPDTPNPWAELAKLRQLVAQQAEDDGLWFNAATAPEAYLQQELRKLHAAVEGTK